MNGARRSFLRRCLGAMAAAVVAPLGIAKAANGSWGGHSVAVVDDPNLVRWIPGTATITVYDPHGVFTGIPGGTGIARWNQENRRYEQVMASCQPVCLSFIIDDPEP